MELFRERHKKRWTRAEAAGLRLASRPWLHRSDSVPKAWTDDQDRMRAAHAPDKTTFATKPRLALTMTERALARGAPSWMAADRVYGVGEIEGAVRRAGKGCMLGFGGNHHFARPLGHNAFPSELRLHLKGDQLEPHGDSKRCSCRRSAPGIRAVFFARIRHCLLI